MKTFEWLLQDESTLTVKGDLLGQASSHTPYHTHALPGFVTDQPTSPATRKASCSACRWHEITLILDDDDFFMAYSVGKSIVPGERDYITVHRTQSAMELVEMLTIHKPSGETFLPAPSRRALAQAAEELEDIQEAYLRAVRPQ